MREYSTSASEFPEQYARVREGRVLPYVQRGLRRCQ
jgi:hypothetical protein